jgi:hypothetical protein
MDQKPGVSQLLLISTLSSFTLSKRDKRCWINHPLLSLLRTLFCFLL